MLKDNIRAKRHIKKAFVINYSIPKGYGTRSSDYYKYYTDTDSKSFQNVLDFFTLLEKKCHSEYGKKSKYKKSEVEFVIRDEFPKLTNRGCQTIMELNKLLKKRKKLEFANFKFNGIIKFRAVK